MAPELQDALDLIRTVVARTAEALATLNTIVFPGPTFRMRFQIAPGAGPDIGISNAAFRVLGPGDVELATGNTNAEGEVPIPLQPLLSSRASSPLVVEILGTRFPLRLVNQLPAVSQLNGQQLRMHVLSYMTGYQLVPIANARPDDGADGPRTQQSFMNFQMDEALFVDGDVGPQTRGQMTTRTGA